MEWRQGRERNEREEKEGGLRKRKRRGRKDEIFKPVRHKPSRSFENHWHVIGRLTDPLSPSMMCIGIDSLCSRKK